MKKILVTGGAGFIGSNLVEKLLKSNYNVIVIDDLSTGKYLNIKNFLLNKNFIFFKGDVNNSIFINKIFKKFKFDYIFHYAAVVGVERTIKNPILVLNDIKGFENILNNMVKYKSKKIFYASSSEIYGEPVTMPQDEKTTPLNSRLPYAVVKNVGESFLRSYKKKYNVDYTIFRFFNTYGPRQSNDFVISKFVFAAKNNKNINIYGDGKQSRTFLFIDDNVSLTYEIFKKNYFNNDVINIGSDKKVNISHLANTIKKITKSNSKIVYVKPLKEGDMYRRQPSIFKLKKTKKVNFTSLNRGLLKTIKFYEK